MKSLVFVIQSAGYPDTKTKFDCSSTCSGSFDAPIGTDTFIIKTFDSIGGAGNVLSAGLTSLEVRAGIANQFKAVLGGIVARLSLALAPSAFTLGTPASGTLSVVPLDASGNTIIGSDAFATPVIVTLANGAFSLGNTVIKDASMASIPISYTGAIFSSPATVTATAAGLNVASLPLILASQTSGSGTNGVSGRTIAAGAFVDSIGVNTHFNYNGTPYTTAEPTVVADILALHIKHVREGMLYPFITQPVTLQAAVHALSAAGVHDLAGIFPNDLTAPDFTTRWSNYFDSTGGSAWIEAVEAPNECDLNGCLSQAASYQQTIYSTVKGYGPSTSVTVLGPSFANSSSYTQTGSLAPNLDAGNIHLYTLSQPPETTGICQVSDQCAGGANLNSVIGNTTPLDALLRTDAVTSGLKPIINSESGICTTVDASGNTRYNDVPRDVQAVVGRQGCRSGRRCVGEGMRRRDEDEADGHDALGRRDRQERLGELPVPCSGRQVLPRLRRRAEHRAGHRPHASRFDRRARRARYVGEQHADPRRGRQGLLQGRRRRDVEIAHRGRRREVRASGLVGLIRIRAVVRFGRSTMDL